MLLTALDLIGVFVFALSGGVVAAENRLDPFGVVFLAFVAAASGGIARDVLIGAIPPYALTTWTYLAVATLAGLACYFGASLIRRIATPVAVFDAIGLGLFAVVGARKALDYGLSPLMAAMMGMITAIGGGIARDILTAQTPMVLQRDIYALAALGGAGVLTFGVEAGLPTDIVAPLGAALTIVIRLIALKRRWSLPTATVAATVRLKPRIRPVARSARKPSVARDPAAEPAPPPAPATSPDPSPKPMIYARARRPRDDGRDDPAPAP